jgi:hypothetical protein
VYIQYPPFTTKHNVYLRGSQITTHILSLAFLIEQNKYCVFFFMFYLPFSRCRVFVFDFILFLFVLFICPCNIRTLLSNENGKEEEICVFISLL